MKQDQSKVIFFVSDLHLGAQFPEANKNREVCFVQFLESMANQASHLFILGDLFEFWMEYKHFIPKAHIPVLGALHKLSQAGVSIHYVAGNHDFALGNFFTDNLKIHIHRSPLMLNLQGLKCWLHHGDGLAPSDWKYRLARKIIDFPLNQFLFQLLHPDWGMALANWVAKSSRDYHGLRNRKMSEYEKVCLDKLSEGFDAVLHGHTHALSHKEVKGGTYINTGEWLRKLQYVKLEGGKFSLMEWDSEKDKV